MSKRIIIAGGGTGGHIFPAIAIANALRKLEPAIEILFVGAKGRMEMEKVPQAGYKIQGLDIAGFNRSSLIKNISLPLKLLKSFFQVRRIFKQFKPHAAVGVGGYSSFPVLRYAQAKGIKTFIHEANSFGGKANMMLARRAEKVFVATDNMEKFFPSERLMVTGNPVRKCILSMNISKDAGLKFFGLQPNRKTVFVFGGSLGASSINKGIASGLDRLLEQNLQVIWQTGKEFTEEASQLVKDKAGVWTSAFITDIENAYAAADVVVSRAGAMSVSELCVVGKPVIFVPYPHAAEDHQTANAMALVNKRAALIVNDAEVKSRLVDEVLRVVSSPALALELSTNISKLKITNADEVVALEILQSLNVPG